MKFSFLNFLPFFFGSGDRVQKKNENCMSVLFKRKFSVILNFKNDFRNVTKTRISKNILRDA